MVDFEQAAINALNTQFEGVIVSGCFFHLEKNMWKHIQQIGLQTRYNNDIEFAVNLRMLAALAFVPVNDVIRAYELIVSSVFWMENDENDANSEKQQYLNYFEKNYIGVMGRTQGQGRRKARFPIELWNMFELTVLGENFEFLYSIWISFVLNNPFSQVKRERTTQWRVGIVR